jgi:hypothetical protein
MANKFIVIRKEGENRLFVFIIKLIINIIIKTKCSLGSLDKIQKYLSNTNHFFFLFESNPFQLV